jgi:hypothetical protein
MLKAFEKITNFSRTALAAVAAAAAVEAGLILKLPGGGRLASLIRQSTRDQRNRATCATP